MAKGLITFTVPRAWIIEARGTGVQHAQRGRAYEYRVTRSAERRFNLSQMPKANFSSVANHSPHVVNHGRAQREGQVFISSATG